VTSCGWLAASISFATPACVSIAADTDQVRPPAVAGSFYPADAPKLRAVIQAYLSKATTRADGTPLAIVAPHAGYTFSGQVAADAFAQVAGQVVDTVVILGTNHTVPGFNGVALYPGRGFQTPLGVAAVDTDLADALIRLDRDVVRDDEPHLREHSIEVQVPFVQHLWPKARLLPLVVGAPDLGVCERLGPRPRVPGSRPEAPDRGQQRPVSLRGRRRRGKGRRTIPGSRAADGPGRDPGGRTGESQARIPGLVTSACGEAPILAAVEAARALGATQAVVVSRATSADSLLGEPGRAVGYGAVVFGRDLKKGGSNGPVPSTPGGAAVPVGPPALTPAEGAELVTFARESIAQYLQTGTVPLARTANPRLQYPQGAFVTLRQKGDLRGCIGHLVSQEPLLRTVGAAALSAALQDPRFPPVGPSELPSLDVEVSVLSPLRAVAGVAEIVTGRDGVVLEKDGRSAVFLPEVASDEGWTRDEMLGHLCEKARLPTECWRRGARFQVFQSQKFSEVRAR